MNNIKKIKRISERYEIIELIGIGGMSYVYKGYDTKEKKIVAIKMLKEELASDEDFVLKFKNEALANKDIIHENVVQSFNVIDENNMHFIILEYVEGTTLNKYIKSKGKLTNEETVNICLQVASGLLAAHNKGIIHRDIKPQNIVIGKNGIAKITDFGIARAISSTTKNISVIGTVHYISPEQARNENIDFRSDIYSFGCTMYEMITGKTPFEGDTPLSIILSHIRENIKKPSLDNPKIYPSIEKIIFKCTRMLPRERYQTINELIEDLNKSLIDKAGSFIRDAYDDEEGRTVVISDADMKIIKAMSHKFINSAQDNKTKNKLTPEQKAFLDDYAKRKNNFSKIALWTISIIAVIICVFFISISLIKFDTYVIPNKDDTATGSVLIKNLKTSFLGINYDIASNLARDYGLNLIVVMQEYSDIYAEGEIISVNDIEDSKDLEVVISKGKEIIDFTDREKLHNTKISEMVAELNERNLEYEITEINDYTIPRGYIIGVNKKNSAEYGKLIITVSKGPSSQYRVMPELYNMTYDEIKKTLEDYELALGSISFRRSDTVEENHLLLQSVKAGEEVKIGTVVDIIFSSGISGEEYEGFKVNYWYGDLSVYYTVPNNLTDTNTVILQVRLVQTIGTEVFYTEVIAPQEYKGGTIIPLVFSDLEGLEYVQNGQVEVVDVQNDKVLVKYDVLFWPKG